jgi:uncharacterized protein YigA (DUF484 family)
MDRAAQLAPEKAAAEAVKAFLRIHRARLGDDPELLALVAPSRFDGADKVCDFQRYALDRLLAENAALRAERDGLRGTSDRAAQRREAVKKLVLDLIAARNLGEAIAIAAEAGPALGADAVMLGIEAGVPPGLRADDIVALAPGIVDALIERDAVGALLRGISHPALFPERHELMATAIFRLRIGKKTPPALIAVASAASDRFDDEAEVREIGWFARALERTVASWLERSRS